MPNDQTARQANAINCWSDIAAILLIRSFPRKRESKRAVRHNPRYTPIMADLASDPLAWRPVKAPSLVELEVLASDVFQRLPRRFRELCADIVIQVDDFPTDEVLDHIGADSEFDLLGLFQGVGLPFRSESAPVQMPNMIWLYRRPILDYWAEHDETLGAIVRHVLVHEVGHHFGLSDADMAAIEAAAEDPREAAS
jgi:predicted Zn-dependent protease with MMP-like domain